MTNEHQGLSTGSGRTLAAGAVAVASGALAFAAVTSLLRRKPISEPEDAPEKAWRRSQTEGTVVGRTVTINRPRSELYAFWHDFSKLPQFMEDVKSVTASGDGRWELAAFAHNITDEEYIDQIGGGPDRPSAGAPQFAGRRYVPIDEDLAEGVLSGDFDVDAFIDS